MKTLSKAYPGQISTRILDSKLMNGVEMLGFDYKSISLGFENGSENLDISGLQKSIKKVKLIELLCTPWAHYIFKTVSL